MAFSAKWILLPDYSVPYQRDFALYIEGGAEKYVIDWGDGTTSIARPYSDRDGDGLKEVESPTHQYADGSYSVSISQGNSGHFRNGWEVIMAQQTSVDQSLIGDNRPDIIKSGEGEDTLRGLNGDDILLGGGGNDRIVGGEGADALYGGFGADILFGDAGDDRLEGEDGADRLRGGAGADTFVFVRPQDKNGGFSNLDSGRDTVLDFEHGVDRLDFTNWTKYHPTRFVADAEFSGDKNHGEVRVSYDQNGIMVLSCDSDGNGFENFSVRLIGHHDLSPQDFIFG